MSNETTIPKGLLEFKSDAERAMNMVAQWAALGASVNEETPASKKPYHIALGLFLTLTQGRLGVVDKDESNRRVQAALFELGFEAKKAPRYLRQKTGG